MSNTLFVNTEDLDFLGSLMDQMLSRRDYPSEKEMEIYNEFHDKLESLKEQESEEEPEGLSKSQLISSILHSRAEWSVSDYEDYFSGDPKDLEEVKEIDGDFYELSVKMEEYLEGLSYSELLREVSNY